MLLCLRLPGFVGGSPHMDLATALPSPWGVPAWSSEPIDLSDPDAPGERCRDLGAVTGDCSSLGWAALTGQVSRPCQPQIQLVELSEQSTGMNAGGRQSMIKADLILSFILNSVFLLIWPKANLIGLLIVLLNHAESRLLDSFYMCSC